MTTQVSNSMLAFDGGALSYRNKLINGNFDFWQRGTVNTSTDTNGYLADRWQRTVVGSSISQSQGVFTLGQGVVDGEPPYYWQGVVTSVANAANLSLLSQPIEGVRTLAGQSAVLSFWAKADASKNIAVEFVQNFGTGGSPSALVTAGVTTCALTTSWQKFTVSVTLPSISGKTLGSNFDDKLAVNFWFDAGANFNSRTNSLGQQSGTFSIARVQLEKGTAATPYEDRPKATELALSQRYYETGIGDARGAVNVSNQVGNQINFKVTKRSAPTVTITTASGTPNSFGPDQQGYLFYGSSPENRGSWTAAAEL